MFLSNFRSSGGRGGASTPAPVPNDVDPHKQIINVASVIGQNYAPLDFVPLQPSTVQLYVEFPGDLISGLQLNPDNFTIVRSSVGGAYDRLVWDSALTSSTGNGTPIPDADAPPTGGLEDVIASALKLIIFYLR